MLLRTAAAAILLIPLLAAAQTAHFEVASVKPSAPNQNGSSCDLSVPGAVRCSNMSVRNLISIALDLGFASTLNSEGYLRLVGGPNQLLSQRFDVEARTATATSPSEKRRMLRTLLEERFRLRLKEESRQTAVTVLVRDRDKLGLGMKASTVDCNSDDIRARRAAEQPTPCGVLRSELVGGIRIFRGAGPMSSLLRQLQETLGRPAVDETGLTGTFEWSTKYRPDNSTIDAPLFEDAIRQDLGLRITQSRRPYEVFVIESIEAPSAN